MVLHKGRYYFRKVLPLAVILLFVFFGVGFSPVGAGTLPNLQGACAAPSNACWEAGFHQPGVSGTVYAMVRDIAGNLYVGGEIIAAGGVPVNNLAMWDGTTWRDVGGGITNAAQNAKVYALAIDGNNNLIVGGVFDHAGGTAANNLAVWNGTGWQEIGGGVNGGVLAIKVVSGSIGVGGGMYVGGWFSQAGTVEANNIVYRSFDPQIPSPWSPLGAGITYPADPPAWVNAIEVKGSLVYVGGYFSTAGATSAYGIARYNGASWEAVDGGLMSLGGEIKALLAVDRAGGGYDLYAGGAFTQIGPAVSPVEAHNIARWDGSSWQAMGYGIDGEVNSILLLEPNELILGGDFSSAGSGATVPAENVVRWNGSVWSGMGSGVGTPGFDGVNALILSETDVIAGGRFDLSGSLVVNHLARWNGSAWTSMDGGLGVNNWVEVLLPDNDALWVAGPGQFGSLQAFGLAKLTGLTWSGEGSPAAAYIRALVKSSSTELIAGGAFSTIGVTSAANLARWTGSAWLEFAGGTNGDVNALAWGDGKLYVGGEFTSVGGGTPANYVAMYDGTWQNLGDGFDGPVLALALASNGDLYAAGEFNYAGNLYVNHIARWDGSQWQALGGGLSGSNHVLALTLDGDGRLYAGGYFGSAGGKQVNGVAMWNGLEWSALGSGLDNGIGALAVDGNGYLYAGGDFLDAGSASADHIARWDGFAWSALGSGTDSNVFALAPVGNRLMVGGGFKKAGGIPSTYLGAYTFPPPVSAPAPTLNTISPAGIPAGGAGFWLTVDGADFSSRSVVRWNGNPLTTTYVSGSQLRAFVPADKIVTPDLIMILVSTPAPNGGGSSLTKTFAILENYRIFLPAVIR